MANKQRDFSVRIPTTSVRIQLLKEKSVKSKSLSRIRDIMFKPSGADLKDYSPDKVCVRLREFMEEDMPSTLVKITTTKISNGYTDEKEKLGKGKTENLIAKAKRLGFEKWGEMSTVSTEYLLNFDGLMVSALSQKITPVGRYLKIESPNPNGLKKTLKLLGAKQSERIQENAAVLLAKKQNLLVK